VPSLSLAGLVLEGLHCSLVDLWEVFCFLHILVALLRFACLMLPLVASRMLCSLPLDAWILAFHRQTLSVYDKVHLACLLATGYTLWILLWKTFCSPLFRSFDIPSFCDHFLGSCCPCIPRLLGCGAVVVIIAGPSSLTSVSISSIVLWGSCPLVVACVFSICESVCYVHEVSHCFWLNSAHLFN
jgi:hypothetical protein